MDVSKIPPAIQGNLLQHIINYVSVLQDMYLISVLYVFVFNLLINQRCVDLVNIIMNKLAKSLVLTPLTGRYTIQGGRQY